MHLKSRLICILIFALTATFVFAQDISERENIAPPPRAAGIPTEGFWPTKTMLDRFIDRLTADMADEYNFNDEQLQLTRDLWKARFPEFLNENRAEIQTLLNQYFEALLDDGPPSVEAVAEWAGRIQPLLAEFGELGTEITEGMREYLNDEQTVMLDAQSTAFNTGLHMVQNKMSVWANGGYDPETEWINQGSNRRSRKPEGADVAETEVAVEQAQPATKPLPKDEWTIFTEQFVKRYELNDEQKQKAFLILRRQQEARDRYLRRKATEMAHVTKLLTEAETDEARAAALDAFNRLNAPVDRIFDQLKERLDTLPTRAQRKVAAEAGSIEEEKESVTPEEMENLDELGYVTPPTTQPE